MSSDDTTAPLDSVFAEVFECHGRSFQQYALQHHTYFSPIDEEEINRLELMHTILSRVFDNRLIFPPVESPQHILECGFGAGDWAIDVAEQYPNTEVLAIDVSPHMIPDNCPDNLEIQIDDLNGRFTFRPNHFDIAHSQMISGGIDADRWPTYIRDIYRVLKPGGWCQMVELYLNAQSDNGSLTSEHGLSKWSQTYLGAMQPQKDPRAALRLSTWMRAAGFGDVETKLIPFPMCGWSAEGRQRSIGSANEENIQQLLYSIALYPMTKLKEMDIEEFEALVAQAQAEARDVSIKAYFPLYVCIGRKPG